jgi:hypothetical protein
MSDESPAELWIADSPIGPLQARGQPVWPVPDPATRAMLARLAGLFGANTRTVVPDHQPVVRGSERVAGLTSEVSEATELYAHLTGRLAFTLGSLDELTPGNAPAVLVLPPAGVTLDVLERVDALRLAGHCVGIICAESRAALVRQVLLRSAAAGLRGPLQRHWLDVVALGVGHVALDSRDVLGSATEPAVVREALGTGYGVVTIVGHSDGVDAWLPGLVLCPMDRPLPADATERLPNCRVTGVCHRLNRAIEDALASDTLLPPEGVAARVLVMACCSGALYDRSLVDPRFGLALRLASSSSIGALVTTWEIAVPRDHEIEVLSALLASGIPVGDAVVEFGKTEIATSGRFRPCLFGDPRTRIPPATLQADLFRAAKTAAPIAKPYEGSCLELSLLVGASESVAAPLIDALRSAATESALWRARDAAIDAMVDHRFLPWEFWPSLGHGWTEIKSPYLSCGACGGPTRALRCEVRVSETRQRVLGICARCGVIADAPAGGPFLRLSVERSHVAFTGAAGDPIAAIAFWPNNQPQRLQPESSYDGSFRIPDRPSGFSTICGFAFGRDDYTFVRGRYFLSHADDRSATDAPYCE